MACGLLGAALLPLLASPALALRGATGISGRASTADPRYRVRPGDTLWDIARREGTSVRAIATANAIRDASLVVSGRWLLLPARSAGGASAAASPVRMVAAGSRTIRHTVRLGETLASISHRYGPKVGAIAAANRIADPNLIVVGRRLVIPSTSRPSRRVAASTPNSTRSGTPWSPAVVTGGRRHPSALTGARLDLMSRFDFWARQYGFSPDLLKALCYLESGWQRSVVSPVGAVGIGQLMPETARFVSTYLVGKRLDRHNVDDNIRMSARYLRWLLDQTGWDVRRAVGSYYQGLRAMQLHGPFRETVVYVNTVLALRTRF